MRMATLQVEMPEDMLIFVEAQAIAKGQGSPAAYVRALIASARKEAEQAELEQRFRAAVLALERGEPNPISPEDWKRLQECALGRQEQAPPAPD
jgi:hypothetical protein